MRHCLSGQLVLLLFALSCTPSLAAGQEITGTIIGAVTDQSGGVLPGVTVTVKNVQTGLSKETTTAEDGG